MPWPEVPLVRSRTGWRQVHIDPLSHADHWLRYSRKRRVKGKPRISLIGRFGLWVWSFLPRPVVSPSSCQLAAR